MRCQKLLSNSSIKNFSLYTPCTVCVCCVCLFFGWPVMMPLISRFCIRTFGTNGNKMREQEKTARTNNTWTIIARRFCSQQRTLRNFECSLESFLWMPCATMGIFEMLFIFLLQVRISKQHLKRKKMRFKVVLPFQRADRAASVEMTSTHKYRPNKRANKARQGYRVWQILERTKRQQVVKTFFSDLQHTREEAKVFADVFIKWRKKTARSTCEKQSVYGNDTGMETTFAHKHSWWSGITWPQFEFYIFVRMYNFQFPMSFIYEND